MLGSSDNWVQNTRQQQSAEAHPGQPFALDILDALIVLAEDPDSSFLQRLKEGVLLALYGPALDDAEIWPTKQELLNCPPELEPMQATIAENYPSATNFADTIETTFLGARALGMVLGPFPRNRRPKLASARQESKKWTSQGNF